MGDNCTRGGRPHQRRIAFFLLLLLACGAISFGKGPAGPPVSFRAQIAPLLQRRCATCHNEESSKGGYRLDTFAHLLRGGDSGSSPVVAGNTKESELYQLLTEPDPQDRMPQKADPLSAEEIALVAQWINEGATFDGAAPEQPLVALAREAYLRPAPALYARPVPVTALAFNHDATQLAAPGYHEIIIWNVADGSVAQRVDGLPERINSISWDATQNLIAVAGGSPGQWGTIALLDAGAGFQIRFLCDLSECVLSVAFSPDGRLLAAGCADRTVRVFQMPAGGQPRLIRQHADWVQAVAFSPDGKEIASGSRDRTVRVFNAQTGELEATYTGHDSPLVDVTFSTTGASALSIAHGKSVHIWDSKSGNRRAEITGFNKEIERVAAYDSRIITAGTDGLVRVHQMDERFPLFTLVGHRDAVEAIALSPLGGNFATGSHDGEVFVWETVCGTWIQHFLASPVAPSGSPFNAEAAGHATPQNRH